MDTPAAGQQKNNTAESGVQQMIVSKIIKTVTFATSFVFANSWHYTANQYSTCYYSYNSQKYDSACAIKTETTSINIGIDGGAMTIGTLKFSIDSTSDGKNPDGEFIRTFYAKNLADNVRYVIVYNQKYINIGLQGFWKISYQLSNSDTTYSTGSGFGINSNTLVTNYHVVQNMKTIMVKIGDQYSAAKLLFADKQIDIAILKTDKMIKSCKINDSLQDVGTEIIAYGYPKIDLQGQSIKATKGIISSRFGFQDDIETYQIDAAIQNGNSGGPIAHKNKIVGITVSKLTQGQNVNYAIKSVFLTAILKSVGIRNTGSGNPIDCTFLIIGWDK